jgi:L-2-hydroxyglutarate oxidase
MQDLVAGGSGVRAQAVGPDGRLLDDFVFEETGSTIHVLNAPSPGATASLAIGRLVARRALPLIRR